MRSLYLEYRTSAYGRAVPGDLAAGTPLQAPFLLLLVLRQPNGIHTALKFVHLALSHRQLSLVQPTSTAPGC